MSLEALVQTLLAPSGPCARPAPMTPWGPVRSGTFGARAWPCCQSNSVGTWDNSNDTSGLAYSGMDSALQPSPEWPIVHQCLLPESIVARAASPVVRSPASLGLGSGDQSRDSRSQSRSPTAPSGESNSPLQVQRRPHPGYSPGGTPTKDAPPSRLLAVIGDAQVGAACSALTVSGEEGRPVEVQVEAEGEALQVQFWDASEMDPLSWLMLGANAVLFIYDVARPESLSRLEALLGISEDAGDELLLFVVGCGGVDVCTGATSRCVNGGAIASDDMFDAGLRLARRHKLPFLEVPVGDGWDCAIGEALAVAVAEVDKASRHAKARSGAAQLAKRTRPRRAVRHQGNSVARNSLKE